MAYIFGDSFDLYTAMADMAAGYWDSSIAGNALVAGRFTGSRAWNVNTSDAATKNSGANDAVHHIVCAYQQTAVLSGTTLGVYFQLSDGATNQVCIVFRSDGVILLTSGTPAGTVLDTYTGAVTAQSTWFAFEFEVVINNTTGSWAVRKNGNTSNDHALGSLNTRPGTNAYANKLTVGKQGAINATYIDDLLWRSDASSVAWMGDIRCYTRMPASDGTVQFSPSPNPAIVTPVTTSTTASDVTATSRYVPFTASFTGTVGSIQVNVNAGVTGNMKSSIFSDGAGSPAAVLGSATNIVNPVTGTNTFTFGTPVAVAKGTQYWFGVSHDVTVVFNTGSPNTSKTSSAVAYASFPTASPGTLTAGQGSIGSSIFITRTSNFESINEAQQDAAASYVYDSTPGDADFYNIAALAVTPVATIAVTTRGFIAKSDAGSRFGTVRLKSVSTTVAAPSVNLSTSWGWAWRSDVTDPATSAPWTAAAVNAATIGPYTVS